MKKFIILIPVYNDWKSVSKLLTAIDSQVTAWNAEVSVLIINDASTENRVAVKFDFNSYVNGDINGDGTLNNQDIILIVTMVLVGDYSIVADMNKDGTVNILDVVLVVFIILNPDP